MKKTSVYDLILIGFTILLGLTSSAITFLPLWIGDALYGVMIFFIVKFLHVNKPDRTVATISLLLCYLIAHTLGLVAVYWMLRNSKKNKA